MTRQNLSRRIIPKLPVYRNCSKPIPPLEPKEEREAFGRRWDSVQEFFAHWETNSEGDFAGVFNNYGNLQEFEELFRGHFRDFLGARAGQETQKPLNRKVRRWGSSPFRGLNFFDFEHAPIFHGRTRAIGGVLEALEGQVRAQRPFVLVVGSPSEFQASEVDLVTTDWANAVGDKVGTSGRWNGTYHEWGGT
jgi:hypothetical protein